ncbi:MAG: glycosyltransferase family 2 protein, partial [Acidobacteriota bacterium]
MSTVSIIITTFSRPSLLPRAVASAFAAGSDVEVIVVDDASTDETAEVCSKLGRIKYIRLDKNLGTARARNAGIDASLGQFISFHDDDDRKLPGTLDELTAILEANPNAGLAYGQTWAGNDELEPKGEPFPLVCYQGDVFWRLIEANFISPIATVFRKACLEDVGIIDPNLVGVDDYDLWIRIAER